MVLTRDDLLHVESDLCSTSHIQVDISVWNVYNVPPAIRSLFYTPPPLSAWILQISPEAAGSVELEAWIRSQSSIPLIDRTQLDDGSVALMFAPPE